MDPFLNTRAAFQMAFHEPELPLHEAADLGADGAFRVDRERHGGRDSIALEKYERSCYFAEMGKGQMTRAAILERAMDAASRYGLGGLTIGTLAEELDLSKSGLFAHFKSKEALQIDLLDFVAANFTERVIRPALQEPRGIPRIRAIFEKWMQWSKWKSMPGGCLFVAASTEFDDRPGPVRDRLVELQREWLGAMGRAAAIAVEEKQFESDLDPAQFAHEMHGIMLANHHARRLLHDPKADARATAAFEALIDRCSRTVRSRRKLA